MSKRPLQRLAGLVAGLALAYLARPAHAAADAADAKRIFNQRCTACHTYGKGVKVGPDLKGVTERRQRPWLLKFIRSSQTVIQGGDPIASGLFKEFKQQRMPDWTDLSEAQITAILEWFKAAGPEQKEPDERNAEVATSLELEKARRLWNGSLPLANGGLACATCHSIKGSDAAIQASLGPDLSTTYLKYQDRALTIFLKRPCFRRQPEPAPGKYLTPEESFALKAYMRQASLAAKATAPEAK